MRQPLSTWLCGRAAEKLLINVVFCRCHCEELEGYRNQCDEVLLEVSAGLNYLIDLQKQYINVSTKTNALHEACEHLLAKQVSFVLMNVLFASLSYAGLALSFAT